MTFLLLAERAFSGVCPKDRIVDFTDSYHKTWWAGRFFATSPLARGHSIEMFLCGFTPSGPKLLAGSPECAATGRLPLDFSLDDSANEIIHFNCHFITKRAGMETPIVRYFQGLMEHVICRFIAQFANHGLDIAFHFREKILSNTSEFSCPEFCAAFQSVLPDSRAV